MHFLGRAFSLQAIREINPLPDTTNLQQTTLKISTQKCVYSLYMKNYSIELENIVIKEEIAHYEQFQLLPQSFQKSSELLYEGKG